jgi:hypothetical protein
MIKVFRRIIASLAFLAVIAGAIKALFNWLSRTDVDKYEVWSDEEEREEA